MTDERTISGKWVEGLFHKALGPVISRELAAQLAAAGLEVHQPLAERYPVPKFIEWLQIAAASFYPAETPARALHQLGARVVTEFKNSGGLKSGVLMMARLMGPRRTLRQLADLMQGRSNLTLTLTEQGSREVRIDLNEATLGDFLAGALVEVLAAIGARSPHATTEAQNATACVIHLRWK